MKKGRQARLKSFAEETRTLILYESPHRLLKTLEQLGEVLGQERQAVVCRELTKYMKKQKEALWLTSLSGSEIILQKVKL